MIYFAIFTITLRSQGVHPIYLRDDDLQVLDLNRLLWQETKFSIEPRIKTVEVTEETITAHLEDGRSISVPLAWSWRLSEATVQQRNNFELIGDGIGIHWPDIDEDISAEGMLSGVPAKRPERLEKKSA